MKIVVTLSLVFLFTVLIALLFGQDYQFRQQQANYSCECRSELLQCQQMNVNLTRLLKDKIMTVKIK